MGAAARRPRGQRAAARARWSASVAAEPASEDAKKLLAEAQRYKEQGADKPFLDVWFADARNGYVVGAYNLIFRTADGGKTWESWFDRTDNPKFFNLYAIRPAARRCSTSPAKADSCSKLDAASQRFKALAVPYKGSFFGVADAGTAVLVFGLRGNVVRAATTAAPRGAKVDAGLPASIVGSRAHADDGAMLLADAGGRIAASTDGGRTFAPLALAQPMPLAGLVDAGEASSRSWGRAASPCPRLRHAELPRPHGERSWPPSLPISKRCRSSRDLAEFDRDARATRSNAWSSTTGLRWWSSARIVDRWCSAISPRRGSC